MPARGFRHAEGLQAQRAGGDPRQIGAFLRGIAMPQKRTHDVHLGMAGGAVAAGALDLLKDRAGPRQRQAGAAILVRDERGKISGLRQRRDEFRRIGGLAIEFSPILARKLGA